jgi:hypothetical protein
MHDAGRREWLGHVVTASFLWRNDGITRMKSQAHWQTDVTASWALGTADKTSLNDWLMRHASQAQAAARPRPTC